MNVKAVVNSPIVRISGSQSVTDMQITDKEGREMIRQLEALRGDWGLLERKRDSIGSSLLRLRALKESFTKASSPISHTPSHPVDC